MKHFAENITKEIVNTLPILTIDAKIEVITNSQAATQAAHLLMNEKIIGFDTETKPSFVKGCQNKVALLQLSTAEKSYLFRLNKIGKNQALKQLLESPEVKKIGLSVRDDFRELNRWMSVAPQNFVELQTYVRNFGIMDMSLQKIYAIVFGKKISKSQQLSNWEATNLTPEQQRYAATDAWACLAIYNELNEVSNK